LEGSDEGGGGGLCGWLVGIDEAEGVRGRNELGYLLGRRMNDSDLRLRESTLEENEIVRTL
jgi:hypothetical protein